MKSPSVRALKIVPPVDEEIELEAREQRVMTEAMGSVLAALRPLRSDSTRMRVLAAASCMHGADGDAEWFLDAARKIVGSRCARCGHVRGPTAPHY